MATTIVPQTLTVTISSVINLNSQPVNSENVLSIASITSIDKRIVTVPFASEVTLVNFGSAVAAGTLVAANVKYIQITNKDSTNYVRVRVKKAGAETFDVKIDAGGFYIAMNPSESVSATAAAFAAFVTADSINCQANTGNVDVEFFAASI